MKVLTTEGPNMKIFQNNYRQKGFTLAELLIVVAIIAVLVAIAIPIFNIQIEKSREAYDIDTMRQAASAAIELYYSGVYDAGSADKAGLKWWPETSDHTRDNAAGAYDPRTGKFYKTREALPNEVQTYGKGTTVDGGTTFTLGNEEYGAYAPDRDYTKAVVMVAIYPNGAHPHVDVYWKNNSKGNTQYVGGANGNNVPKYCIRIGLD